MPTPNVINKALHNLLCGPRGLFSSSGELLQFISVNLDRALLAELPGERAELSEVAYKVQDLLQRQGLLGARLFGALAEKSPGRYEDIAAVARSCGAEPPPRPSPRVSGDPPPAAPPARPTAGAPADAAILIALKEEWEVFWALVGEPQGTKDEESGRYVYSFEVSSAAGRPYRCVAVWMGDMGPGQATDATQPLLRAKPLTLVNLGIAAAIHDDLKLCDVVVADQVDDYLATTKATARGNKWAFDLRGSVYKTSFSLVQDVDNLKFAHPVAFRQWQAACANAQTARAAKITKAREGEQVRDAPASVRVHLASGPVLAAAAAFSAWVRERDGLLKALEMEAAGMMLAAHQRRFPPEALVLRGISDFGDDRKAELDRTSGGAFRYLAMFNATQLLLTMMQHGLLPRHPGGGTGGGGTGGDAKGRKPWEAKVALMEALQLEPNAIVRDLDTRLGGAGARPGESPRELAERVAVKIDALGEGPDAARILVEACYLAVSDVKEKNPSDRPGAKRILRRMLGEWLPRRYGCTLGATSRSRSSEPDACEDMHLETPNHEIGAIALAHSDERPVSFETRVHGKQHIVVPRGALPVLLDDPEIRTADEIAERIADALAEQIPSPVKDPERQRQKTRDWLAFLRDPGEKRDPKHIALTPAEQRKFGEDVLKALKAIYPPLQLVTLGERAGAEEGKILYRMLTIFLEDDRPGSTTK